jgi:hypothetical protein
MIRTACSVTFAVTIRIPRRSGSGNISFLSGAVRPTREDSVASIEDRDHEPARSDGPGKIVIAGTGRSGTTLLVQILTDLGLDTGFEPDAPIDERAAAGLELPAMGADAPRIVKSPHLSTRLGTLLDRGDIAVDHVIVPVRDLDVAAASRVRLTRYGADLRSWGGLFGTSWATRQREALALIEYELVYTITRHDLDHTFLEFPRFARDWSYLRDKLGFLDPALPSARWQAAVAGRVRPALIHETPLSRRERALTVAGTAYNRVIVRPARAAGHLLRRRTEPTGTP